MRRASAHERIAAWPAKRIWDAAAHSGSPLAAEMLQGAPRPAFRASRTRVRIYPDPRTGGSWARACVVTRDVWMSANPGSRFPEPLWERAGLGRHARCARPPPTTGCLDAVESRPRLAGRPRVVCTASRGRVRRRYRRRAAAPDAVTPFLAGKGRKPKSVGLFLRENDLQENALARQYS